MSVLGRVALVGALVAWSSCAASAAGFSDWAAIVVAGDDHAHSGAASDVFDDARRDLVRALEKMGFSPSNIVQFSVQPDRFAGDNAVETDPRTVATRLWDLSNRTSGGCFVYFTSHGSPDGILMGEQVFSPQQAQQVIGNACGDRPTVVVVSACFSGVFVPALAAPDRLVLTAARPDRTSFGCGEADKYTYFDQCFLQSLPANGDFPDLGRAAQACVAAREKKEHLEPPSEPQLSIGALATKNLPHWK